MYHFTQLGWQCLAHRKKLFFGEVDLILQKEEHILLIEVKSLHNEWMAFERIQHKQIQNLIRNKVVYQLENKHFKIECRICFVNQNQMVDEVYLD